MKLDRLRDYIRPLAVALLVFVLLLGAVMSGALELWRPGMGVRFTIGVAGWFKAIPDKYYELTLAGLLGYTAARTVQQAIATHSTAKYNPPARADVEGKQAPDDPDATARDAELPRPKF